MKLLTSYSSPSSSSTISFDPTMCNSKSATTGCLSGILRRILCSRGLQTHPSDHIREADSLASDKDQELKDKQKAEANTTTVSTPGIVARLMGLEAMMESTPHSLSRSRSLNCVDYLEECNRMQGMHRRVKSTLSFREVPAFIELESEKFFILSFENMSEGKEYRSKGRKGEMGSAELKQKRDRRKKVPDEKEKLSKRVSDRSLRKIGNDGELEEITNTLPLFKVSSEKFSQNLNCKEVVNEKKLKKRKKKTRGCRAKKTELECNSEETSPVSVLDFEHKAPTSEVDSIRASSNPRSKLSPELENDQHFPLRSDGNLTEKTQVIENKKFGGSEEEKKQSQECIDIWGEVCLIAEAELVGSDQTQAEMWKQGDCESLTADFESRIFDHLLNELIDQLLVGQGIKTL